MIGTIIYGSIFFVMLCLYALGLLLRGRCKTIIEGVLGLICMGMLIASFFVFGWKTGVGLVVLTLFAVPITKALAIPVAHRLLGYRTGYSNYSAMESDSERFMSGQLSMEQYFENVGIREAQFQSTLASLARRPEIQLVLQQNQISSDGYLELYWDLMKHALPDLAWDILGNPNKLQKLIDLKRNGAPSHEISATFREYR